MVLVITIIVLLILAGITIGMLTGDNGIINNAKNAKEETEISNEKEVIDQATIEAMGRNKRGNLVEEEFQEAMDRNTKEGDTEVTDIGDQFEVYFKESNRYYMVDKNGSILDYEVAVTDPYPGDITKDENGNTLDGSEEHPFEINCIEDLVVFSIMSNEGNQELGIEANTFTNKYVVLKRTLNFKSGFSYKDATNTKYGDLNLDGTVEEIKTELTKTSDNCVGFTPIKSFNGYFNGNNNEIQNIYINKEGNAALMITYGAVKIENIGVTGKVTSTSGDAAGICMGAKTIENCHNKAEIKTKGIAGGICVSNNININKCSNTGNITTTGGNIGGISGGCGGVIENCFNTGKIIGENQWYAGGICAGHANGTTTIKNCYNEGEIIAKKAGSVGGILGTNGEVIENCYNLADVTGNQNVGGIVGSHSKEIYNCYNTAIIVGGREVGGIASQMGDKIINCYNLGNAKGNHTGGIVGQNQKKDAIISNCFNIGTLYYSGYLGAAGGILGKNTSSVTINNSYNIGTFESLETTWPKTKAGIIGREDGTSTLNKCYYLKTEEGIRSYRRDRRCRVGCNPINKYKRNNSRYIK